MGGEKPLSHKVMMLGWEGMDRGGGTMKGLQGTGKTQDFAHSRYKVGFEKARDRTC